MKKKIIIIKKLIKKKLKPTNSRLFRHKKLTINILPDHDQSKEQNNLSIKINFINIK